VNKTKELIDDFILLMSPDRDTLFHSSSNFRTVGTLLVNNKLLSWSLWSNDSKTEESDSMNDSLTASLVPSKEVFNQIIVSEETILPST
jgi:hypothetical protein